MAARIYLRLPLLLVASIGAGCSSDLSVKVNSNNEVTPPAATADPATAVTTPEGGSIPGLEGVFTKAPVHRAPTATFTDTDGDPYTLSGPITIAKAVDESDIETYAVYWGSDADTKLSSTPLAVLPKTGDDLQYLLNGEAVPAGATHLLIYTQNSKGEMPAPTALPIVDLGVPQHPAAGIAFTDGDLDPGQIAGLVTITPATDESDLTQYVLYWGTSATVKQGATPIATLAKSGVAVTYTFGADTPVPSAPAATHLLVYASDGGVEIQMPTAIALIDRAPPAHGAASVSWIDTDLDKGQLGGSILIAKATSETDVTHYDLYWGTDATTKRDSTPFASLAKTGADLSHVVGADTPVPTSPAATHVLVFARNGVGERLPPTTLAIADKGVPTSPALGAAFTDADLDGGEIAGNLVVTRATDETTVTGYALYWGSSTTSKLGAAITTLTKTGANVTHTFASGTAIPASATHLLAFAVNADGEMTSGPNVAIGDKAVPTQAATGLSFTDGDLDGGQVAGVATIARATNEASLTHYVLYWGSDATTKQSATAIATLAKTGGVTHTFAADTAKPGAATHLLVYTRNADGEMSAPYAASLVDKAVPTATAAGLAFTDVDTDSGEVSGDVTITKATSETGITHYVLYWGSNTTTKQSGTPLTTIAKAGSDLTYTIAANTVVPTSPAATHLLIYTKNGDGEMLTGTAVVINDDTGSPAGPLPISFAYRASYNSDQAVFHAKGQAGGSWAVSSALDAQAWGFEAGRDIAYLKLSATERRIYYTRGDGAIRSSLRYGLSTNTGTSFGFSTIDTEAGQDYEHIFYAALPYQTGSTLVMWSKRDDVMAKSIKYREGNGSDQVLEGLSATVDFDHMLLANAPDDTMHMVYSRHDYGAGTGYLAVRTKQEGQAWTGGQVINTGCTTTRLIDFRMRGDDYHLLYSCYVSGSWTSLYRNMIGGSWSTPVQFHNDQLADGSYARLSIDGNGKVHIIKISDSGYIYYTNAGGANLSTPETIASLGGSNIGRGVALAVDSAGLVYVATATMQNSSDLDVRLYYGNRGAWNNVAVENLPHMISSFYFARDMIFE